jgi:hypothetical protein
MAFNDKGEPNPIARPPYGAAAPPPYGAAAPPGTFREPRFFTGPTLTPGSLARDIQFNRMLFEKMPNILQQTYNPFAAHHSSTETPVIQVCRVCVSRSRFQCSGCKIALYCSQACQKQDWPQHKLYHT